MVVDIKLLIIFAFVIFIIKIVKMKITKILSNLIAEDARFQILNKKYILPSGDKKKNTLPFEVVKQIIFADPTTRVPENYDKEGASVEEMSSNNVKVGKYSQWLLNLFAKPYITKEGGNEPIEVGSDEYKAKVSEYRRYFLEDLSQFTDLLTKYDRFKGSLEDASKKDINNVKSLNDLSHLKVKVGDGQTVDLNMYRGKKVKKEEGASSNTNFNIPGAEILKVGSEYTLLRISDKGDLGSKAASYFGGYNGGLDRGETNWCTAAENSNYSKNYRQQGPLYILIANDDKGKVGEVTGLPSERYQLHFPTDQFKYANQHGGNIQIIELLNGKWSEFKEILKPEFAKGLTVGGQKLVIDSFTTGNVGKFIALYGLDDLIDSLPDTLTEFQIMNKDTNNNIVIDIPEEIGRFQNLMTIMLDNCVASVPQSICNLKKLKFLALMNNKQLTEIPECIVDLPKLLFVNLKGSNNIQIPSSFEEKGTDLGGGMWELDNDYE